MGGHTGTVRVLLDRGAEVNAKDRSGGTALMFVISGGHNEIVRLLREVRGLLRTLEEMDLGEAPGLEPPTGRKSRELVDEVGLNLG